MPPPSLTTHLPPSHPAHRQRPKSPNRVLAEAEAQWLFTDAELANTPSIQDGMSAHEERETRSKGVNFIVQVGIMLKLPQLTLSTAAVFFQRFLMRASLKKERAGIPKLHHYQSAATALFLATKVEESCRKPKEMILAFCRVAQKNPNLVIDEQSKDWWRWRDCILHNEDVLLETLCFDLTLESPHRQLFEMLKWYGVEHNKRLRNAAWAFVTDSNNTQLCLLCTSRTIAVAGLYAACRYCDVALPDDAKRRPWWETQHVRLKEILRATQYMCANFEHAANKLNGAATADKPSGGSSDGGGERSIYVDLATPAGLDGAADGGGWDSTRLRHEDVPPHDRGNRNGGGASPAFVPPPTGGSERRHSNASSAAGAKRDRAEEEGHATTNGQPTGRVNGVSRDGKENKRPRLEGGREQRDDDGGGDDAASGEDEHGTNDLKAEEERLRVRDGDAQAEADVAAAGQPLADDGEVSEEGEVEE